MSDFGDMERERQRREMDHLSLRIADFMRRYRPDSDREIFQFEADLIAIVQTAHMQAVEPFARKLADAMRMLPAFPFPAEKK